MLRELWRRFVTWFRVLFLEPIEPGGIPMAGKPYFERGRDARTGRFIPVAKARKRKRTAVVERVKRR